jgi:hypothetical protein
MGKKITFSFLTLILVLNFYSCGDSTPKITQDMRSKIDTMTQKRLIPLLHEIEKKCAENSTSKIKVLADSLVTVRMQQIQEKLNNTNN